MRDHCRGGGTSVAAAVAVIEQHDLQTNHPFSTNNSIQKTTSSPSLIKQDSLFLNKKPTQLATTSYGNNDSKHTFTQSELQNKNQIYFKANDVPTSIDLEGNFRDIENSQTRNTKLHLNFERMSVKATEIRKSHSPTNSLAASKNTICLEEAMGGNSQFTVRKPLEYIHRTVSDKSDFETLVNRGDIDLSDTYNNLSNNIKIGLLKVNQTIQKIGAVHNFEEAVNDFNLTAEDVEGLVSKYNSLKRYRNPSTTEGHQKDIVLSNEYAQSEIGDKLHLKDNLGDYVDTNSSDTTSSSDTDSVSGGENVINEGLATITEEDRATGSSLQSVPGIYQLCTNKCRNIIKSL